MRFSLLIIMCFSILAFKHSDMSFIQAAHAETFNYREADFDTLLKLAENGDLLAMQSVAARYSSGEDVEPDILKSEAWNLKAAEQGSAGAQNSLGLLYLKGASQSDGSTVPKDVEKGMKWLHKAAELGYPIALNNLAMFYITGLYVPKDVNKAIALYTKAAEQDNAMAMTSLAMFYSEGEHVPRDSAKALYWIEKAAKLGDVNAKNVFNRMTGVKTESTRKTIELTNPVDREDFLEIYTLSEYISNDKRECRAAGYIDAECVCELSEEYRELSALAEKMDKKHPEWKDNNLHFEGKILYIGTQKAMKGKMVSTSINKTFRAMQRGIAEFEKKLCSKE